MEFGFFCANLIFFFYFFFFFSLGGWVLIPVMDIISKEERERLHREAGDKGACVF